MGAAKDRKLRQMRLAARTPLSVWAMAAAAVLFAVVCCRGVMSSSDSAREALAVQGYSDISILRHKWFFVGLRGCDGNDAAAFVASAKNPKGEQVEVLVCVGWPFKGSTIRSP